MNKLPPHKARRAKPEHPNNKLPKKKITSEEMHTTYCITTQANEAQHKRPKKLTGNELATHSGNTTRKRTRPTQNAMPRDKTKRQKQYQIPKNRP